MTISSQTRKNGPYVGNDATTQFAFTFKVFASSDVLVVRTETATGVETTLALTTDYTVSLNADQNANPGGTVTLLAALASTRKLTISSEVPYLQATDLTNQGGFYPAVITNALDKLTILAQQLSEKVSRSVKVNISSTTSPDALVNDLINASAAAVSSASAAATSASDAAASAAFAANTTPRTAATGSTVLPASTTANRDVSPAVGYLRYNTSLNQFEGYSSSGWGKVGGGTSGTGTDAAVYENDATITQSYTIGQGTLISGATITIASPGVVTLTAHGFVAGSQVFFQTTGALPTGLSVDYGYWVISTGLTADSFQLSLTEGGVAINTSGTQSGVHSCGKLKNASSAGTVTVISGATITVPTNATWTVV